MIYQICRLGSRRKNILGNAYYIKKLVLKTSCSQNTSILSSSCFFYLFLLKKKKRQKMRRYQFVKHIILNRFDQNTQQTVVDDVDGNLGVAENISIKFADRVRKARKHSSVNIIFNASMISTFPQDKCLSNSKNKHLLISVLKSKPTL